MNVSCDLATLVCQYEATNSGQRQEPAGTGQAKRAMADQNPYDCDLNSQVNK